MMKNVCWAIAVSLSLTACSHRATDNGVDAEAHASHGHHPKADSSGSSPPVDASPPPLPAIDGGMASMPRDAGAPFDGAGLSSVTTVGDGGVPAFSDGGMGTGIAECDEFVAKYLACANDKLPEAARGPAKDALRGQIDGWRQAAETNNPDVIRQARASCVQAQAAAAQATRAMDCKW